jgi:hypothetical protein
MTTLLRFLEVLALGVWVGAAFFVGALLAPGVFAALPTRELAGNVVGMALHRLHLLGFACALIYWGAAAALAARRPLAGRAPEVLVVIMVLVMAAAHFGLTPRLTDLRSQMAAAHGSLDATPKEDPLRVQFGQLHGGAFLAEMMVLLLGLTAFFLTVRRHS